jgi:hypothetical protein
MLSAEDYNQVRRIAQDAAHAAVAGAIRHQIVSLRIAKLGTNPWLTLDQAAGVLGVPVEQIRTGIEEKRLVAAKNGKEVLGESVALFAVDLRKAGE